jgi:hypothetical protein
MRPMQAIHLNSSLTFVPATMLKQRPGNVIGPNVFASKDEHIIVADTKLANSIRDFAMREGMAIAKIPVGTPDDHTDVEFFWLDVKKNKKEMSKLGKLLSRRWLELLHDAELAREDDGGNLLSPDVTEAVDAIEHMIELRRFVSNGADPTMLSKKKRTVLLFHHTLANAPDPN